MSEECIICGSNNTIKYSAECAPFLVERMFNGNPMKPELIRCNNCDFSFYTPRPTDIEMDRFYSGYRSDEYQHQRELYEPYYTKTFNDYLESSTELINERKHNIQSMIAPYIHNQNIKTALDYGGDNGNLFPDILSGCEKYVYDISEVEPVSGVKSTDNIPYCLKFDYIQCCNLLEHVSDPKRIIRKILSMTHTGTILYFEVPYDTHFRYHRIKIFLDHPILNRIYCKINGKSLDRFFSMHEHINHFSPNSLLRLLFSLQIKDLQIKRLPYPNGDMICCVAKI